MPAIIQSDEKITRQLQCRRVKSRQMNTVLDQQRCARMSTFKTFSLHLDPNHEGRGQRESFLGLAAKLCVMQSQGQCCTSDKHNDTHLIPECMVLLF